MDAATITLVVAAMVLSSFTFYTAGHIAGRSKGFDEGWVKRHFEQSSYETHRRDRRGRFAPAKST